MDSNRIYHKKKRIIYWLDKTDCTHYKMKDKVIIKEGIKIQRNSYYSAMLPVLGRFYKNRSTEVNYIYQQYKLKDIFKSVFVVGSLSKKINNVDTLCNVKLHLDLINMYSYEFETAQITGVEVEMEYNFNFYHWYNNPNASLLHAQESCNKKGM